VSDASVTESVAEAVEKTVEEVVENVTDLSESKYTIIMKNTYLIPFYRPWLFGRRVF
jgi:hypothetical protein